MWLDEFDLPIDVVATELGTCRIVNLCKRNDLLRDKIDGNRTFGDTSWQLRQKYPENVTQPFMTTSSDLGMNVILTILKKNGYQTEPRPKGVNPFILMIHNPYELPTNQTQKYFENLMDYDTFFVTPQLNTIDDSMIAMKPKE